MFTHLNTHSHYSLLRGTASPEAICAAVKDACMDSVALTDTNGLYGLLLFLEAAKDHGLRPIVGAEVRSISRPNRRGEAFALMCGESSDFEEKSCVTPPLERKCFAPTPRATLLVQSQTGYANLCRILSDYHLSQIPPPPLIKGGISGAGGVLPPLK